MRILVLTNLYPPHHAGSFDLRCQTVTEALRKRGHTIQVLTSNHGVGKEQRDPDIERRLDLNGAYGHPRVVSYLALSRIERYNQAVLRESIESYSPELVHTWSLTGLSKSTLLGLQQTQVPVVYDVSDDWIANGIREDPWLMWWNQPDAPFFNSVCRKALEVARFRDRLESSAPTRFFPGCDRFAELYRAPAAAAPIQPTALSALRFNRIYFCSEFLKSQAEAAGFSVEHAGVIYPGIRAEHFAGPLRPRAASVRKLLIVARLTPDSGVTTALEALRLARENGLSVTLTVYGRGESDYVAKLRSFVVQHQLPVEFQSVSDLTRDTASLYRQHDALLYTIESEEPFNTTPLEAMASGLPVIAARAGGVQEVLRHGETAFTYKSGDAWDLASRMSEIQIQPALRQQVAENAQNEVMSRFNESAMIDQIEAYLEASVQMSRLG